MRRKDERPISLLSLTTTKGCTIDIIPIVTHPVTFVSIHAKTRLFQKTKIVIHFLVTNYIPYFLLILQWPRKFKWSTVTYASMSLWKNG